MAILFRELRQLFGQTPMPLHRSSEAIRSYGNLAARVATVGTLQEYRKCKNCRIPKATQSSNGFCGDPVRVGKPYN